MDERRYLALSNAEPSSEDRFLNVCGRAAAGWETGAASGRRRNSPWREANFPVYASSKAALNMLTIKYAAAYPRMRINSVDPGFTSTDFNEHRGTQTVEEGPRRSFATR
jgi:NAD(P)-dependent dehydrogenase (short-subunit alcohol dehydrogenase family)